MESEQHLPVVELGKPWTYPADRNELDLGQEWRHGADERLREILVEREEPRHAAFRRPRDSV